MNIRPRLLTLAILVALVSSTGFCQLPPLPKVKQFGIDGFRLMLQHGGLEVSQTNIGLALEESPRSTVLVLLGDLRLVPRFSRQIDRFVERGGSLLVASDLLGKAVTPTNILGVWVRSTSPAPSHAAYRDFRDCPIVRRLNRTDFPSLFAGVETIIANRPARLIVRGRSHRVAAWLPSRSSRNPPELMSVYQRGAGRMLFVADHSIFINEMLIHEDNARFASNVSRWLCEDGNRTQLVVIHDGRVLPAWGLGENPPAIPLASLLRAVQRGGWDQLPIGDSVLPVLNASLADFQQTDQFNMYLRRLSLGVFGRRSIRAMLLILVVLIAMYFMRWMALSRSRPPAWISDQDWRQPLESKHVHAVREQQYQAYLRSLVREFFVEAGIGDWHRPEPPQVTAASARHEAKISKSIAHLWRIATRPRPKRISRRGFERSLKRLQGLRQLQLSGELRLE